jgi:hypothetical protein
MITVYIQIQTNKKTQWYCSSAKATAHSGSQLFTGNTNRAAWQCAHKLPKALQTSDYASRQSFPHNQDIVTVIACQGDGLMQELTHQFTAGTAFPKGRAPKQRRATTARISKAATQITHAKRKGAGSATVAGGSAAAGSSAAAAGNVTPKQARTGSAAAAIAVATAHKTLRGNPDKLSHILDTCSISTVIPGMEYMSNPLFIALNFLSLHLSSTVHNPELTAHDIHDTLDQYFSFIHRHFIAPTQSTHQDSQSLFAQQPFGIALNQIMSNLLLMVQYLYHLEPWDSIRHTNLKTMLLLNQLLLNLSMIESPQILAPLCPNQSTTSIIAALGDISWFKKPGTLDGSAITKLRTTILSFHYLLMHYSCGLGVSHKLNYGQPLYLYLREQAQLAWTTAQSARLILDPITANQLIAPAAASKLVQLANGSVTACVARATVVRAQPASTATSGHRVTATVMRARPVTNVTGAANGNRVTATAVLAQPQTRLVTVTATVSNTSAR